MTDLFSVNTNTNKITNVKDKEMISIYAKIESVNVGQTSNQSDYLNLQLMDETGTILAKKWNITEEEKKQFKIGDIVHITGYGNEFNGKTQIIIESIRVVDDSEGISLENFYKTAPLSKEEIRKNIIGFINKIKNAKFQLITKTLFEKYEESYLTYPAATKNHHAYISGLGYHVLTMLKIGRSLCSIYPNVNEDLLYAGIILHDIGKVIELSDYRNPEYTTIGKLIGHINIAFEIIGQTAKELGIDGEEVMLLQHIILAHHGELEFGSPKRPQILEAELLHLIDLMDSRINMILQELEETPEGDFSKRIYTLDGRAFYKHSLK